MDAEMMRVTSDMLFTAARVSSPILMSALAIGVAIGLVQTVLQVQEATLTFVPKLIAISGILATTGGWMLGELEDFMIRSLDSLPALILG